MKTRVFFLLLSLILATGCVSINSVSMTSVPPNRSKPVSVERSKTIFLGFNFDNDFVNDAVEDLQGQCPNGKVTGILTKDETINYFLFFVWAKRLTATGYCVVGS